MTTRVVVLSHRPQLAALGLDTLEGARAFSGGEEVKNQGGRRDVRRFSITTDPGTPLLLYMKRIFRSSTKAGLSRLFACGRVRSSARIEFENLQRLRAAGIASATPVAYGEECSALSEGFSYLISEAIGESQPLDEFLASCHDAALRRRVAWQLGMLVRRLHGARLAWPDLFARHIFLEFRGREIHFRLMDVPRVERRLLISPACRARDLANLHLSIRRTSVSDRERALFLRAYAAPLPRLVTTLAQFRARRLLRQGRFKGIHD
jgi:hypothetical protein